METIYHRSDFDFILPVTDAEGNAVGWPSCDWEARLTTAGNLRGFTAGCVGGVCRNCVRDGDSIRITAGRHGLPPGRVRCEFSMAVPDSRYPGGVRRFADVYVLDIRLTDEPGAAEVSGVVRLPVAGVVSGIAAFCDLFSAAAGEHGYARMDGGRFDCELNGLRLTYAEAVAVYEAGTIDSPWVVLRYYGMAIRTNLPPRCASWAPGSSTDLGFRVHSVVTASDIEVLNLATRQFDFTIQPEPGSSVNITSFAGPRLRRIIGAINCKRYTGGGSHRLFGACPMLEDVSILDLNANLDLSGCPRISAASLACLVNRRYTRDGRAITVTLHPEAFARLTDPEDAGWHAVLEAAAEKEITFASA